MIPFHAIAAFAVLSIAAFTFQTYTSFERSSSGSSQLNNYDSAALASSSRVANITSDFLYHFAQNIKKTHKVSLHGGGLGPGQYAKQRKKLFTDYLKMDLATKAIPHHFSKLLNTASLGLDFHNKKNSLHDSYKLELLKSKTPNQKTKLISEENAEIIDDVVAYLQTFEVGDYGLKIKRDFLVELLDGDTEATQQILSQPDYFYLYEDNINGIAYDTLPNGIALEIPILSSSDTEQKQYIKRFASSTLSGAKESEEPYCADGRLIPAHGRCFCPDGDIPDSNGNCPSKNKTCPDGSVVSSNGTCPQSPVVTIAPTELTEARTNNNSLILDSIPSNRIGIIHDPSRPADSSNPISVVNKKHGGITSVHLNNDGHIQINIGDLARPSQKPKNDIFKEPDSLISQAVLVNDETSSEPLFSTATVVDILPRVGRRYGIITKEITIAGRTIPVGSIIVAKRDSETLRPRPNLKAGEFESFRVYNSDGVLISLGGADKVKKFAGHVNFNYTAVGTRESLPHLDSVPIFQSFTTAELFPGDGADTAIQKWTNMQADLAADTQLNINLGKKEWHKKLLKRLLNEDLENDLDGDAELTDLAYLDDVFFTETFSDALKEVSIESNNIDFNNPEISKLFEEQRIAMGNYIKDLYELKRRKEFKANASKADLIKKQYYDELTIKQLTKLKNRSKEIFKDARKAFNQSVKNNTSNKQDKQNTIQNKSEKITVTPELQAQKPKAPAEKPKTQKPKKQQKKKKANQTLKKLLEKYLP